MFSIEIINPSTHHFRFYARIMKPSRNRTKKRKQKKPMTVDAFIADKSGASKLAVVDSLELAAYILARLGSMSHLKLQKLLY
jgi:hypothetical protein